jgi:hypothetical protein
MTLPLPLMDPLNVVLVPLPPAVNVKLPRLMPPLPAIEPMVLLTPSCITAPVSTVSGLLLGRLPVSSNVPPATVVTPW